MSNRNFKQRRIKKLWKYSNIIQKLYVKRCTFTYFFAPTIVSLNFQIYLNKYIYIYIYIGKDYYKPAQ